MLPLMYLMQCYVDLVDPGERAGQMAAVPLPSL